MAEGREPGRVRRLLRCLTPRGRAFLAGAVVSLATGEALGERDLVRVAVLLAALPLLAVAVVARIRYRVRLQRRLSPARVQAGHEARVLLTLENLAALPTGTLLMEDSLPYALGGRPRFVLRRVESHGVREATYAVRTDVRGRFTIGPLVVRLVDPFGCAELTRSFTSTEELLVTPVIWPLPSVALGGDWLGGGDEGRATQLAVSGEADASIREYRDGDDLRRIHWRTSARTGELMVRRDEQPRQLRGTVVLDTRWSAHRGEGATGSFEWAVSAAASVGVWLTRQGYGVRLVTTAGETTSSTAPTVAEPLLLDALSAVTAGDERTVGAVRSAVAGAEGGHRGGLLVAVLGTLQESDVAQLAALAPTRTAAVAVLLDTPTWSGGAAGSTAAARRMLADAGWRTLVVGAGDDLAAVWPLAGRRPAAGVRVGG